MKNNELIAKIILCIILVVLVWFGIIGLKSVNFRFKEKSVKTTEVETNETKTDEIKGIEYVDFSKQIVVDESTGILYIGKVHHGFGYNSLTPTSYAYLCPYYSENGKKQKLVDGEIVELDN